MHGCPLSLGPYLEVECINQSETNFSRTAQSQQFWQGGICHVWTFQSDKHWRHSQKERLANKLVDIQQTYVSVEKMVRPLISTKTVCRQAVKNLRILEWFLSFLDWMFLFKGKKVFSVYEFQFLEIIYERSEKIDVACMGSIG